MRAVLLLWLAALPALAEVRHGAAVTVGQKEVVDGDLYAVGRKVTVLGKVNGDLVVLGGTVEVLGEVKGEVISVAPRLDVAGNIGSLRALGGSALVRGTVVQDAAFFGGDFTLDEHAAVGRDLLSWVGMLTVNGSVLKRMDGRARSARISGTVGGPLEGSYDSLTLSSRAWVGADVLIESPRQPLMAATALVAGAVEARPPPRGRGWLLWTRAVIGLFALSLLRRALFPGFALRSQRALGASLAQSLGLGALAALIAPAGALAALAVGAVIGGWWLGGIALFAFLVAALVAFVVVAGAIGAWIWEALSSAAGRPWLRDLVGLLILTAACMIPYAGGIIAAATILLGLGAQVAALPGRFRLRSTARLDVPPPPLTASPLGTH